MFALRADIIDQCVLERILEVVANVLHKPSLKE